MYLKTSKVNQNNKESVAAKEYWKLEDSHSTIYKQPAHYTEVILQFIKLSFAKKILEFGCGSGRNLNQLNDFFEKQTVEENFYLLRGIDINQHLIEYGKTNFSKNLELIIGDENSIKKEKNNFYDLIFTVSVLDHLPDPSLTIQELIKKTKRYIIFLEPFNPDIKKTEKIENISTIWKKQSTTQATPYTYFHNYKLYFKQNKLDIVLELPLPTHLGKIGPFYKLFLVQKINNKTHVFDKKFLIEQLQITAILTNIRNSSSYLAKLNKSVQTIDDLNQQIKTKDKKIDQISSANSKFLELIKTELSNTYNNKLGDLFLKGTKSISAFMKLPYEIYKFRNNIKQKIPKILGDKTFDLFIKNFCSQSIEEISKFLDGLNISNKIKSDAYIALSKYFRNNKNFSKHVTFANVAYKMDPKLYKRKFLMFAYAKNQDYQNFNFLLLTLDKDRDLTEKDRDDLIEFEQNKFYTKYENLNEEIKKFIYSDFKPLKSFIKPKITVATIMDEFSLACFNFEWNLILLKKDDWLRQIKESKPDFLFVESAWRGNAEQWNGALTNFSKNHSSKIYQLIEYCRENNIPTVFWNKEDPANFDTFINAAKEFDYIFTSAKECIIKYLKVCGHKNVYNLNFAAQPILHNPAARKYSINRQVAFAGGWYANKHENRKKYLSNLLDATMDMNMNMSIFDRFSNLNSKSIVNHKYPLKYNKYLRPKLSYYQILSVYRMFKIFLNVNSVEDSETMFSRRVFELLACGTNIVSSPSQGINLLFPKIVGIGSSKSEISFYLNKFENDNIFAISNAHLGYREVMLKHTYKIRCQEVISKVLPNFSIMTNNPKVSVIATTNRPERLENILNNFACQNHDNKELILTLNDKKFDRTKVEEAINQHKLEKVKVFDIPENITLGGCINHVINYIDCDYWAKFDDDDIYGKNYLKDSILPFTFTEAGIVGKKTYICKVHQETPLYLRNQGFVHNYTNIVCGGTFVVDMKIMNKISFNDSVKKGGDTVFLNNAKLAGIKIYSADYFNFIQVRNTNPKLHTWHIDKKEYLKNCESLKENFNPFI